MNSVYPERGFDNDTAKILKHILMSGVGKVVKYSMDQRSMVINDTIRFLGLKNIDLDYKFIILSAFV